MEDRQWCRSIEMGVRMEADGDQRMQLELTPARGDPRYVPTEILKARARGLPNLDRQAVRQLLILRADCVAAV